MSEKFNPLAEAQNNASEDRRRFYDWVGDNADHKDNESFRTANADMADYLKSRVYEDDLGNIREAESGRFTSNPNTATKEEYYERLYTQTEANSDARFTGKGLKELAEMVHEANVANDKNLAIDARAAFDDQFVEVAEKLGWEGVVTHKDGTVEDRNKIADKFLAHYEDIMSGVAAEAEAAKKKDASKAKSTETHPPVPSAETSQSVNSPVDLEAIADNEASVGVDDGSDYADRTVNSYEPESKIRLGSEVEVGGEKWTVVNMLIDQSTGERFLHLSHKDNKGHYKHQTIAESAVEIDTSDLLEEGDKLDGSLGLKQDFIEPLVNQPIDIDADIEPLENIPEDDEAEPLENSRSDDTIDPSENNVSDADDVEPVENDSSENNTTYPAWNPAAWSKMMREKREAKASRNPNRLSSIRKRLLGGAALAAVVATGLFAAGTRDDAPKDTLSASASAEAGQTNESANDNSESADPDSGTTRAETVTPERIDDNDIESVDMTDALNIDKHEGFNQTMAEMGIPQDEWNEILVKVGPELGKMTYPDQPDLPIAYFETAGGVNEWRINMPANGKMPQEALDIIEQARNR